MTDRTPLNTRVDEDVKKRFRDFTHEKKGKIRGEMGRLVERALIEYMDRDRQARLEEDHERLENKVDTILATLSDGQTTHTHKGHAQPTTVTEKAETIAAKIRDMGNTVFPVADVEKAIKDVAGADDRTLNKYKDEIKSAGVYEHPSSDSGVWTVDKSEWVSWVENYIDTVPDADIMDVLEPYPVGFDEYDRMVTVEATA